MCDSISKYIEKHAKKWYNIYVTVHFARNFVMSIRRTGNDNRKNALGKVYRDFGGT